MPQGEGTDFLGSLKTQVEQVVVKAAQEIGRRKRELEDLIAWVGKGLHRGLSAAPSSRRASGRGKGVPVAARRSVARPRQQVRARKARKQKARKTALHLTK